MDAKILCEHKKDVEGVLNQKEDGAASAYAFHKHNISESCGGPVCKSSINEPPKFSEGECIEPLLDMALMIVRDSAKM